MQTSHPRQSDSSTCALPFASAMAPVGQASTHEPQPVQRSMSIHTVCLSDTIVTSFRFDLLTTYKLNRQSHLEALLDRFQRLARFSRVTDDVNLE